VRDKISSERKIEKKSGGDTKGREIRRKAMIENDCQRK
jgi:hypothetical protein